MSNKCMLSDWELDEMLMLRRRGWSLDRLAAWYGVSTKTVARCLARMDAGSQRPRCERGVTI